MSWQIIVVLMALAGMVATLVFDKMRPGMALFSVVVLFMCLGIISPGEALEGFANKGMITVAMLFLVSEGVRQSGALSLLVKRLLPARRTTVAKANMRMLPAVAAISAFLNNTPVVVIFAPVVKRWAERMKMPPTKFLIPLSYATILGGMCTLIGTSTNLVVYGMVIDSGYKGFSMFELAQVGLPIAVVGLLYLVIFGKKLLPEVREDKYGDEQQQTLRTVEAVLGPRFPGINKKVGDFGFERHYGASIREIRRAGVSYTEKLDELDFHENDTLILDAGSEFMDSWGDSSAFLMVSNGKEAEPEDTGRHRGKKWFAFGLLLFMIAGATVGELPFVEAMNLPVRLDMFFFVAVVTVVMAWTKIFPPKKYTKYISWDILITIACAFAISKAMYNSGFADLIALHIKGLADSFGPHALLAVVFIITNLFTELITNNAAAALSFPIALAVATQLDVNPMPFFVTICMAASSSFSSPIGYQTNLIVQGVGNYRFTDFVRSGIALNIISFVISVFVIPLIWKF